MEKTVNKAGWRKVANRIHKRVRDEHGSAHEFKDNVGFSDPSYYSTLKAMDPEIAKPPKFYTVAVVAHYAGFRPQEIAEMAREIGASPWDKIFAGVKTDLSGREMVLINVIREITEADPQNWHRIVDYVDTLARGAGKQEASKALRSAG